MKRKPLFLRPGPKSRFFTRRRSAKIEIRNIFYAVGIILILALLAPYLKAGLDWIMNRGGEGPEWKPITDDGIYDIDTFRVPTIDELDEGAAVTPDLARCLFPDGQIYSATTLAAGYAAWDGYTIKESWELTVEIDSSTNYYPQVKTYKVGDINSGTRDKTYYTFEPMKMHGMDASSDAGVVLVTSGSDLLFNGTAEEDQLAVDANTMYDITIQFNWNGATEEYFGVHEYTQLADNKYTYVPVIKILGSAGVLVEQVAQDGVPLKELWNVDNGDALTAIYQLIPMREDEDLDGDGVYVITFQYTPDGASGDTLDITFHDETRLDRALSGATSQSSVETVAQLTTT